MNEQRIYHILSIIGYRTTYQERKKRQRRRVNTVQLQYHTSQAIVDRSKACSAVRGLSESQIVLKLVLFLLSFFVMIAVLVVVEKVSLV